MFLDSATKLNVISGFFERLFMFLKMLMILNGFKNSSTTILNIFVNLQKYFVSKPRVLDAYKELFISLDLTEKFLII